MNKKTMRHCPVAWLNYITNVNRSVGQRDNFFLPLVVSSYFSLLVQLFRSQNKFRFLSETFIILFYKYNKTIEGVGPF